MKLVLSLCLLVTVMFCSSEALIPRRCKSLTVPENSYLTGDWANYREGRTVGIKCIEGYKLEGASETLCKNGQWTNPLGKCKVVTCPPLKTGPLAIPNPASCKTEPSAYGTHCSVTCPHGYGGHVSGFYCTQDGQWDGFDAVCKDSERPVFKDCSSKQFTVEADPGKATAKVRLPVISYSDNSEAHGGKLSFSATLNEKPISVTNELELSINRYGGGHYVRYTVTDEAGNEGICQLTYRVEDKEPPKIRNCPSDITKTITAGERIMVRVAWKEPTATDNSGEDPTVICNLVNGSLFPEGKHLVSYHVTDRALNEAVCEFSITVNVKYLCVDHSPLAAALLAPIPADPNNACSFLAADRKKCENAVGSFMPDVLWKQVCRKTCTDC